MRTVVVALALAASTALASAAPAAATVEPDGGLAPAPAPSLLPRELLGADGPAQGFYPFLTGIGLPTGIPFAAATGGCGAFGFGWCPRFTGSYLSTFLPGSGLGGFFAPWLFGGPGVWGYPPIAIGIGIY
ncbi:MAG: hypothetical protein IRZ14_04235 [Chloroflexi bacterium]|nr:hypothetical protein [Chloroflexota bacterium]